MPTALLDGKARSLSDFDDLLPAIEVKDDGIVFRPKEMRLYQFYLAELKGKPYLYRKVSDTEVEVYGLAAED